MIEKLTQYKQKLISDFKNSNYKDYIKIVDDISINYNGSSARLNIINKTIDIFHLLALANIFKYNCDMHIYLKDSTIIDVKKTKRSVDVIDITIQADNCIFKDLDINKYNITLETYNNVTVDNCSIKDLIIKCNSNSYITITNSRILNCLKFLSETSTYISNIDNCYIDTLIQSDKFLKNKELVITNCNVRYIQSRLNAIIKNTNIEIVSEDIFKNQDVFENIKILDKKYFSIFTYTTKNTIYHNIYGIGYTQNKYFEEELLKKPISTHTVYLDKLKTFTDIKTFLGLNNVYYLSFFKNINSGFQKPEIEFKIDNDNLITDIDDNQYIFILDKDLSQKDRNSLLKYLHGQSK